MGIRKFLLYDGRRGFGVMLYRYGKILFLKMNVSVHWCNFLFFCASMIFFPLIFLEKNITVSYKIQCGYAVLYDRVLGSINKIQGNL